MEVESANQAHPLTAFRSALGLTIGQFATVCQVSDTLVGQTERRAYRAEPSKLIRNLFRAFNLPRDSAYAICIGEVAPDALADAIARARGALVALVAASPALARLIAMSAPQAQETQAASAQGEVYEARETPQDAFERQAQSQRLDAEPVGSRAGLLPVGSQPPVHRPAAAGAAAN